MNANQIKAAKLAFADGLADESNNVPESNRLTYPKSTRHFYESGRLKRSRELAPARAEAARLGWIEFQKTMKFYGDVTKMIDRGELTAATERMNKELFGE